MNAIKPHIGVNGQIKHVFHILKIVNIKHLFMDVLG